MIAAAALVALLGVDSRFLATLSGPLEDAQCNVETVEEANNAQLYALLSELSESAFFRLIKVNMDGKCPYWGGPEAEDDEPKCESKAEETAVPLCTLGTEGGAPADPFGAADPFGSSTPFGGSTQSSASDFVDQSMSAEDEAAIADAAAAEADCSNEELPTFWLDMCSNIPTNSSDYVNLQLNKESYTG